MNAKSQRTSDSGIFAAKITEFGVVVGNTWGFEAWRAILWIFLELGISLELFFKNQGSGYKILDHRLISQKSRGILQDFQIKPK
jgi:hypothetical protein